MDPCLSLIQHCSLQSRHCCPPRTCDHACPILILEFNCGLTKSDALACTPPIPSTGMVCSDSMLTPEQFGAGQPKAIPWTHTTPIRSAANAYFHQDIRKGDTVAWPTNLGWMMGPWLVFAALLNGATIALFQGSPLGRDFGVFIQSAGVSMLGLVPSIAKAWRASDCMKVRVHNFHCIMLLFTAALVLLGLCLL